MENKLSRTQKITFTAMLILLDILLTHVIRSPKIPGLGFVRICLGPSIVIYSSLALGPFYGALVGGLGDLLGIFLFTGVEGVINPIMTIVAVLLGVIPWCLLQGTKRIQNKKLFYWIYGFFIAVIFIAMCCVFYVIPATQAYFESPKRLGNQAFWVYPVILSVTAVFDIASLVGLVYFGKQRDKQNNKENAYGIPTFAEVAFISLVCEILLMVLLKSSAFLFYFRILASHKLNIDYWVFVICMLITASLNVVINTYLTSMFLRISEDKVLKQINKDSVNEKE